MCIKKPPPHPRLPSEYRADLAAAKVAAQPPPDLLDDEAGASLPRFPSLGAFFEEEDYSAWGVELWKRPQRVGPVLWALTMESLQASDGGRPWWTPNAAAWEAGEKCFHWTMAWTTSPCRPEIVSVGGWTMMRSLSSMACDQRAAACAIKPWVCGGPLTAIWCRWIVRL